MKNHGSRNTRKKNISTPEMKEKNDTSACQKELWLSL